MSCSFMSNVIKSNHNSNHRNTNMKTITTKIDCIDNLKLEKIKQGRKMSMGALVRIIIHEYVYQTRLYAHDYDALK